MDRFRYHASAAGLDVHIHEPIDVALPTVAKVDLEPGGGFFTSPPVKNVQFNNIVFAESVAAVVSGSFDTRSRTFDELASVVIEKFNVLGIVTADRIVARLAAVHPENGGAPSISPLGSHFDNLRIAGRPVEVDLATDTFTRFDTAAKVRQAYRDDQEGFRAEFAGLSLLGKLKEIPERLHSYFPWRDKDPEDAIPEREGEIHCGLVRRIQGLGPEIAWHGHTIYVPGFGVVRLAELSIVESLRSLTMLRIDLGSTPTGGVAAGHVRSNGSGW